jgi:hypothetical protein
VEMVRASGCRGFQSSGGNETRQNVGHGEENSSPISPFPSRTGPRKTTWHSCSCLVSPCCICTKLPLVNRAFIPISAPCALIASVPASSSNAFPCASFPRIRTFTCIRTRWLRRREPGLLGVLGDWPINPLRIDYTRRHHKVEERRNRWYAKIYDFVTTLYRV